MQVHDKGDAHMLASIFASVAAYVSTNIDDIFVIMILLAQAKGAARRRLIAGHFLGVGLIAFISMLGALGLQNLPLRWAGLLGIVPIILGVRACFDKDEEKAEAGGAGLLGMAMITLGNSADNVGVYIPLLTGFSTAQRIGAIAVFVLMTAVWVWMAGELAGQPKIRAAIEKYRRIAIPAVFIALGVFIILDSGLLGWGI